LPNSSTIFITVNSPNTLATTFLTLYQSATVKQALLLFFVYITLYDVFFNGFYQPFLTYVKGLQSTTGSESNRLDWEIETTSFANPLQLNHVISGAVESEVPSSDSDSWQFRLSNSDADLQLH